MADIGDKLRSAREDKGLSIADVEKATKIQSRYLTAIEQNDFDKLPGDFYTRAFIRQYAQVVGLDGKQLLSEFHQAVPESKPDQYVENSIDNKSEEVKETTDNKRNLWRNYLPRIGVILGIIVVILIVYVLYARLSSGGQGNNNANSNVSVSSQSSSSTKKRAAKKSHVRIIKLGAGQYRILGLSSNRRLEVKAGNQEINAGVTINGVSQWQQRLAANQKHSMILPINARTVAITFSNDNATSVRIAGKRIPYAPTGSYLTLRLYIGKKAKTRTSKGNALRNSGNNSAGTTVNSNNGNSNSSQNRQTQSSRQSSRTQSANTQSRSQNSQTRTQQNSQTSQNNQSSSTTTSTGSTGD